MWPISSSFLNFILCFKENDSFLFNLFPGGLRHGAFAAVNTAALETIFGYIKQTIVVLLWIHCIFNNDINLICNFC